MHNLTVFREKLTHNMTLISRNFFNILTKRVISTHTLLKTFYKSDRDIKLNKNYLTIVGNLISDLSASNMSPINNPFTLLIKIILMYPT